jgi:hypothetical protein
MRAHSVSVRLTSCVACQARYLKDSLDFMLGSPVYLDSVSSRTEPGGYRASSMLAVLLTLCMHVAVAEQPGGFA